MDLDLGVEAWTAAFGALTLALFVAYRLWWARDRRVGFGSVKLQMPPGAHWLWGHEKTAARDETAGAFYTRYINMYGPAYVIRGALGFGDILVLADPEALAHILIRRTYDYVKSPVLRPLVERLLGKSLVWVEDADDHARMRRFMSPCFTAQQVKDNSATIVAAAQRFEEKLKKFVQGHQDEADANGVVTINLLEWTWKVTLDVIGQVGFNHDFESGETQDAKDIAKAWHDQVKLGMSFPGFIAPLVIRKFPWITELPFKAIQAQGEVKNIVKRIGQKLVERGASADGSGHDLLSILIHENAKAAKTERETNDQLLDHICTFVVAGHETIAGALNYTFWELAKNHAVQDKLRKEVLQFDGHPTYDDFQSPQLEYLDAVTKEILRLYGPASHIEKVALKDDVIPLKLPVYGKDGKVISAIPIKAGQMLYVSSISAQRLDSVWGDGEVFRPERWLSPNELPPDDLLHKGWGKTFAFAQGPRNCIGTRLAVYEYKTVLMSVVRNFVFHDTGVALHSFFVGSLQPRVIGKEDEGPAMPCGISLVQGKGI